MGYRRGRRHRRHARGSAPRRSANDALAAAEDACRSARSARREAVRHQIRRRLPHSSRPHRQHDAVSAKHAAGAEGRVRMALAGRSALQTRPAGDQARGRSRCFRRRQRDDHLHAGTHPRPSEPGGQTAQDRRRPARGRCGSLQGKLGEPARAGNQRQQGQDRRLDAAHGGRHGEGKGAALDQSRQGAARRPEDVACVLRVSGGMFARVGGVCGTLVLACAIGAAQGKTAHAQTAYPNRPVTLVVPYPAGGTADLLCRFAADKASSNLGGQVVVENRPGGGGGRVGTEAVLRAPPDGYTLLCAAQLTFSVTHLLFSKASFDPRTLEPVSVLATYPLILIARAGLPLDNLPDLIAYARANPGKINYGHQGKGQTGHLLGELLMLKGHFRMTEIPYRGSAPPSTSCSPETSIWSLTIFWPTSRTSTRASSNCWAQAAASGSRIIPRSRPSPRLCRASMPTPGWRWRRRPARRKRSPQKYPTRSHRDSARPNCARASACSKPIRSPARRTRCAS